jgi:hypothetical protein
MQLPASFSALVFLCATLCVGHAADPVKVTLRAAKVVASDAKRAETLAPADSAKPGDLLQYDAVYRNESGVKVGNLQATLPIPAGLELLIASTKPAGAQGSLDGQTFAPLPLMRSVTAPDGTVVREEVPARDYRALRWAAPQLSPRAQFNVSARARITNNPRPIAAK